MVRRRHTDDLTQSFGDGGEGMYAGDILKAKINQRDGTVYHILEMDGTVKNASDVFNLG